MIFSHSDITEPIDKKALSKELLIGSLFINTESKILYTKNLNSEILDVGNSIRYLTEFPEYEVGYEAKGQTSILQFDDIDGRLKLTTKYPFFYLSQLKGTLINVNTQDQANTSCLTFSNGNLINGNLPSFTVSSLTEVSNLTLNSTTNNYALCAVSAFAGTTFNKNPFITTVYYYWTLQPENTRLVTFEDVLSTKALLDNTDANKIIRTTTVSETSRPYKIDDLNIGADKTPKLSNTLNCLGNSIFNVNYLTQRFVLTTLKTTIVCDCDNYKNFLIIGNPPTTKGIEFSFNTLLPLTSNVYIPFAITIQNFNGVINFDKKVEFENGEPLYLEGLNHLINGMLLITNNTYRIRILQKSTNLNTVLLTQ